MVRVSNRTILPLAMQDGCYICPDGHVHDDRVWMGSANHRYRLDLSSIVLGFPEVRNPATNRPFPPYQTCSIVHFATHDTETHSTLLCVHRVVYNADVDGHTLPELGMSILARHDRVLDLSNANLFDSAGNGMLIGLAVAAGIVGIRPIFRENWLEVIPPDA